MHAKLMIALCLLGIGGMGATAGLGGSDFEIVRRAAEQGDPEAQYNLGLAYATGLGASKNPAEAVKWYRQAAAQGHAAAKANLGAMIKKGQGIPHEDKILPPPPASPAPHNDLLDQLDYKILGDPASRLYYLPNCQGYLDKRNQPKIRLFRDAKDANNSGYRLATGCQKEIPKW